MRPWSKPRKTTGFTLVEVLVALLIMAVLAALAWRGVDAMVASRDSTSKSLSRSTQLGTVLTQWQQDLAALYDRADVPGVPALAFDGQSVRLLRRAPDGLQLVTWALRSGAWQRLASPVTAKASAIQEFWLQSQQLLGNETAQLTLLEGVDEWQIYFFRGNAWTNAQSSAGTAPDATASPSNTAQGATSGANPTSGPAAAPLPEAVRMVLRVQGQTLTRDIPLVPQS